MRRPATQAKLHEMQLRDVTGKRFALSQRELHGLFLAHRGIVFISLSFVLMLLSDPPGIVTQLGVSLSAGIWVFAFATYITTFVLTFHCLNRLQMAGWISSVWSPILGAVAIFPTVSGSEILVANLIGPEHEIAFWSKVLTYYLIAQIMEFAFVRVVLQRKRPTTPTEETEHTLAPRPDPILSIGDRRLPLRRLRYLTAQEHYVRVVMDEEEILHRSRLTDLLGQMEPSEGIQCHRSWWISRNAAPNLVKSGGKHFLLLHDGTKAPVARARQADVVAWLDAEGPFRAPAP